MSQSYKLEGLDWLSYQFFVTSLYMLAHPRLTPRNGIEECDVVLHSSIATLCDLE